MPGVDVAWLLSAAGFALAMSATPGPNNTMLAASGANFGMARSVPHILGVTVGFPVMFLGVALGLGGAFNAYPAAYGVLRWVGAAYLLWLAWRIATARPGAKAASGRARPLHFLEAALFQWANPKAWLAAVSGVAAYATESGRISSAQVLVLAGLFLLVTLPCITMWTSLGAGTARLLRNDRQMRAFNIGMAALLVASVAGMLVEE